MDHLVRRRTRPAICGASSPASRRSRTSSFTTSMGSRT
jgi:hypothetical protein